MLEAIPQVMRERMRVLEDMDAQDRRDGTPRARRLRQVPPETGRLLLCRRQGPVRTRA